MRHVAILCGLLAFLAGCASGIRMTDADVIACRNVGCAVFTEEELDGIVAKALKEGYRRGWSESNRQAGRDI